MSYLFIKICFKENSLYYFHKNKKFKKTQKTKQKTFLVGFLGVFWGFFGWVFYCQLCLEAELFCDIYYLRNLCNSAKFPAWPIAHPVRLLKEVLAAWRTEVDKKPATMSIDDAYKVSS
jgi:hypothetical protein